MFVATFWISAQRARFGTKNSCSSGSSGSCASLTSASHSSSKRSERRFKKSSPKMKFL